METNNDVLAKFRLTLADIAADPVGVFKAQVEAYNRDLEHYNTHKNENRRNVEATWNEWRQVVEWNNIDETTITSIRNALVEAINGEDQDERKVVLFIDAMENLVRELRGWRDGTYALAKANNAPVVSFDTLKARQDVIRGCVTMDSLSTKTLSKNDIPPLPRGKRIVSDAVNPTTAMLTISVEGSNYVSPVQAAKILTNLVIEQENPEVFNAVSLRKAVTEQMGDDDPDYFKGGWEVKIRGLAVRGELTNSQLTE